MTRRILIPLIAVALLAAPASAQRGPGSSWAPEQRDNNRNERAQPQEREVPLNSIIRDLRSQYGGQHLDARKSGNRYIISWLAGDGRRLVIEVDSRTGRTLSVRG